MSDRRVPLDLRCDFLADPVGIHGAHPALSWRGGAVSQQAYRILVASDKALLTATSADLWDSGRVQHAGSAQVVYDGAKLTSRRTCWWKVRVWDADNTPSAWSAPARWTMGLLRPSDWHGHWIGRGTGCGGLFRRDFTHDREAVEARVFVCGLGLHECYCDGVRLGSRVLDPAFTRYDKRCLYTVHDCPAACRPGTHTIGVILANGWYHIDYKDSWKTWLAPWNAPPALLFQLELRYADGSRKLVVSDEDWRCTEGACTANGIRTGEVHDGRKTIPDWCLPSTPAEAPAWQPAMRVPGPAGRLVAQVMPPVRRIKLHDATAVHQREPGRWIYDFGRNMAGWPRFTGRLAPGQELRFRCAETLDATGEPDLGAIDKHVQSDAFQVDRFIAGPADTGPWEPRFTYHGFRYVEVSAVPGDAASPPCPALAREDLQACQVHTDCERSGDFRCGLPLFDRIQDLALQSYATNLHGYPTDCPQREKNGWTGDAHLAAEMAFCNFRPETVYRKWMADLADAMRDDGALPGIVPTAGWGYTWLDGGPIGPAWDIAFLLLPWYQYVYRGDRRLIEDFFPAFERHINHLRRHLDADRLYQAGLGDWLPAGANTPTPVTSTAYAYAEMELMRRFAVMLGKPRRAAAYAREARHLRDAFIHAFCPEPGTVSTNTQTALCCALYFGLYRPGHRAALCASLQQAVRDRNDHLDVGVLGAKMLFRVLTEHGLHAQACAVAMQTDFPGYGHMLQEGATTLWEDWTGTRSLNHAFLGDISAWFHQAVAGIVPDPARPAFKHFHVRPHPVPAIGHAQAHTVSPYGRIEAGWRLDPGQHLTLTCTVPPNTSATVHLPTEDTDTITMPAGGPRRLDAGPAGRPRVHCPPGAWTFGCSHQPDREPHAQPLLTFANAGL